MKENFVWFIPICVWLLFLFGGLGIEYNFLAILAAIILFIILVAVYLIKGRILFPKYFKTYSAFVVILILHRFFFARAQILSSEFTLTFISGGFVWLITYNLQKNFDKVFNLFILLLGVFYSLLYFGHKLSGSVSYSHLSLFLQMTPTAPHNHIGDIWSAIMVVLVSLMVGKNRNFLYSLLFVLGVYFLIISMSRSAYLSFIAGVAFLFYKMGHLEKYKRMFLLFFGVFLVLFLWSGTFKSVFLNRPYYLRAILAFVDYPFGVGLGNFGYISPDSKYELFGITGGSNYVHNIILEIMSAIGVFGLVFYYFIYKVHREVLRLKKYTLEVSVLVALGVNFLFDFTYFVPTMLWLWFLALGLSLKRD